MSYPTNYHDASRAYTPTNFDRRPRTPGTPGTFESGAGRFQFNNQSNDRFSQRYDDPAQRSPVMGDTYYFNKEGGAAAGATGRRGPRGSTAAAAAGAGGVESAYAAPPAKKNWFRRHPCLVLLIVLIIVIIGAVAGGVGGALSSKNSSNSNLAASGDNAGSTSSKKGSGSSTASGGSKTSSASAPAATTPAPIVALAKWNMTDPASKIYGVSIGNWLVLERWLMEDWFTSTAGDNSWDEWSFTKNLGDQALPALQAHWNTWVNETSLDALKSVGVNAVRIPVGYWAFVDTIGGEPYLAKSGQTDQLQKMLGWLYDRGMYALIDLHGMPGSQSGDQATGHNTSNPQWFDSDNFAYSTTVLSATLDWIAASNYSSVVQWVCPVNEPRPGQDSGKQAQLLSYYEKSYTMIKNAGLIMMFHNAFMASPMSYWSDFVTGKDPNYLVYNNNPYYGWFPPNSDQSSIIDSVCSIAQATQGYPVPVVMTEYSAINGVGSSFNTEYLNTEISAYAWSGGSFFWNFRADHSTSQVLAVANKNMDQYSFTTLIADGTITAPANLQESILDTINALPQTQCGKIPTAKWTNPSTDTS